VFDGVSSNCEGQQWQHPLIYDLAFEQKPLLTTTIINHPVMLQWMP
jgi:hypothetical protein